MCPSPSFGLPDNNKLCHDLIQAQVLTVIVVFDEDSSMTRILYCYYLLTFLSSHAGDGILHVHVLAAHCMFYMLMIQLIMCIADIVNSIR